MHNPPRNVLAALFLLAAALLLAGCGPLPPEAGSTDISGDRNGAGALARGEPAAVDINGAAEKATGDAAEAGTPQPVAAAGAVKQIYGWGYAKLPNEPVTQLKQVVVALAGFTVGLQSDGSVVVWGATANGEHLSPAGNDFTAVSAGLIHALALRADGTVVGWGANFTGESTPPAGTFTAIAAGQGFSLGLRTDGSIAHWGYYTSNLDLPPDGTNFTAIAAGRSHGLALRTDGSIATWGGEGFAGLGDVPAGTDFVAIAAGGYFSVALRADGSIVAWGDNSEGQSAPPVGTGFTAISAGEAHGLALTATGAIVSWGRRNADEDPPTGTGFKKISAGGNHNVAIRADDTFAGWGNDYYGESTLLPFSGYTAVAVGGEHNLVLLEDGSIRGWGREQYGEATPPAGTDYTAIAAGYSHSLALRADGSILAWGKNNFDWSTAPSGTDFKAIAAASNYSLALKQDGSIVAWGNNYSDLTTPPAGTGFVAMSAGPSHALALKEDGSMVGWGDNYSDKATARPGTGYRAVAAGSTFSLALRADGSIEGWGDNSNGAATPPTGTNFTAIGAGDSYGIALTTTGEIVFWGYNQGGRMTPPQGGGFTEIAAGAERVLALRTGDAPPIPSIVTPIKKILETGDITIGVTIEGDAARVERVNLYFDGALVGFREVAPFEFLVEDVDSGPHKLTAQAVLKDGAGTTQSSRSYVYRLTGPVVSLDIVTLLEFIWAQDPNETLGLPVSPDDGGLWGSFSLDSWIRAAADQLADVDEALFRQFEAVVLAPLTQMPSGQYYQHLLRSNAPALLEIVLNDPALADPILDSLLESTPVVAALIEGQGATEQIAPALVAGVLEIINTVRAAATGELAQIMDGETSLLDPTTWAGLTADQLIARIEDQARPPPGIVAQPVTQTITAGDQTVLTVDPSGAGPFSYQWYRDGVAIDGATGATYALPSAQVFHAGDYAVTVSNPFGATPSLAVAVAVDPPPPNNARLMNLSTRALAQAGDGVLIPGFVLGGSGTKRVLIRGVGPTLANLGVAGTLDDPQMRIVSGGATLASNDDWGTNLNKADIISTAATVGAFGLIDGSKDAALLVDLSPGRYTVPIVGGTGVAIVELYDADTGTPPTNLVNISNRGFVGVGENVMIPGIVVSNEGPRTFLMRVVGPGLTSFGVKGILEDPVLTVFKGQTVILSNDDWEANPGAATTESVAVDVGAFGLAAGSKDAAFVITLPPGPYTVRATGKAGSTGVALVEVYLVP